MAEDCEHFVIGSEELPIHVICDTILLLPDPGNYMTDWIRIASRLLNRSDIVQRIRNNYILHSDAYGLLVDVFESWSQAKGKSATLTELCRVLEQSQLKCVAEMLQHAFASRTASGTSRDSPVTRKLDLNSLENGLVTFQNTTVKFKRILKMIPNDVVEAILTTEFVQDLQSGKCPTVLKCNTTEVPKYYIRRHIAQRKYLSTSIFKEAANDIFVFQGILRHELSNLGGRHITARSSSIGKKLTARFILLESKSHLEYIHTLTKHPVHLINYSHSQCTWVQSQGSLVNIQKHLEDKENIVDEEAFITTTVKSESPTCIADTPGMGKSVLLARLTEEISSKFPKQVTRLLVLSNFIQDLDTNYNLENVCHAIAKASEESQIGLYIIQHAMQTKNCVLLLDGYDELSKSQLKFADKLFETLQTTFCVKFYVSTRPHKRETLEELLGALAFNIVPFTRENQQDFLVNRWVLKGASENDKLKKYATDCLETLKTVIHESKRQEREIAGIPLQTLLLADIYQQNAVCYSRDQDNTYEQPVHIDSIFDMYNKYIDLCQERVKARSQDFMDGLQFYAKTVFNHHIFQALLLLYPEQANVFKPYLEKSGPIDDVDFIYSGIIEVVHTDNSTQKTVHTSFVHRTLAEYLVASLCFDLIKNDDQALASTLVSLILKPIKSINFWPKGTIVFDEINKTFTFENPSQCYFLNSFLATRSSNKLQINLTLVGDESLFHEVLIAAVVNNFAAVSQSVCCQQNLSLAPNLFLQTITVFAAKFCDVEHFKYLFTLMWSSASHSNLGTIMVKKNATVMTYQYSIAEEQFKKLELPEELNYLNTIEKDICILTPIHIAVTYGQFEIVEYLLGELEFQDLLELNDDMKYLLHVCVKSSSSDSASMIRSKIDIINLLVNEAPVLLEYRFEQRTPILMPDAHFELITTLIKRGADVNAKASDDEGLLCTFVDRSPECPPVDPSHYHHLVETLRKFEFIGFDDPYGTKESPLYAAVKRFDVQTETVDIYLEHSVDLNVKYEDQEGDTLLHCAVRNARSWSLIKKLLRSGADVMETNNQRETILHIAVKYGRLQVINWILNNSNLMEEIDIFGNNALHVAMCSDTHICEEIQISLMTTYNVCTSNMDGHTPFLHACIKYSGTSLYVFKKMEDFGLVITHAMVSSAIEGLVKQTLKGHISVTHWNRKLNDVVNYLLQKVGWVNVVIPCELPKNVIHFLQAALRRSKPLTYEFKKFEKGPKKLQEFLDEPASKYFVVSSPDPDISFKRICDTVEVPVHFWTSPILEIMRNTGGVGVLHCHSIKELENCKSTASRKKLKVIIIIPQLYSNELPDVINDCIVWSDLTKEFQRILVTFVTNCFGGVPSVERVLPELCSEELFLVIKSYTFGTNEVSCSTYQFHEKSIPLLLCPRTTLNQTAFDHFILDLIFISEASPEQIMCIHKSHPTITLFGQELKHIDGEKEFSRFCEQVCDPQSAHLFKFNGDTLTLIRTHGSVKNVAIFLEPSPPIEEAEYFATIEERKINIVEVNNESSKIRLLSAIQKLHGNDILITLDFNDIEGNIERVYKSNLNAADGLLEIICKTTAQKNLLRILCLQTDFCRQMLRLNLALHFKKIPSTDELATVTYLLKNITASVTNVKFWLSAEFDVALLESWIGLNGHILTDIDNDQKIKFIMGNLTSPDNPMIKTLVVEYLDKFSQFFPSRNFSKSFEKHFKIESILLRNWYVTENPDVYCDIIAYYLKQKKCHTFLHISTNMEEVVNLPPLIKDVLKKYVCLKYGINTENHKGLKQAIRTHFTNFLTMEFKTLGREEANYIASTVLLLNIPSICGLSADDLCKFWTQTVFATEKAQFEIGNVFLFSNPILVYYIDKCVNINNKKVVQLYLNELSVDELLRNILPALVVGGHIELLKIAFDTSVFKINANGVTPRGIKILFSEMVVFAVIFGNIEMVTYVCDLYIKLFSSSVDSIVTSFKCRTKCLLKLAVQRADLLIFEYFIDKGLSVEGKLLVYACVQNSILDVNNTINARMKIIEKLVSLNPSVLKEKDNGNNTPLLSIRKCYGIHVNLLKQLLHMGADVLAVNRFLQNVLHQAVIYLAPADFHDLVSIINEEGLISDINTIDGDGLTVLESALRYMDVCPETISLFAACIDSVGESNSVFDYAIEGQSSVTILDELITCGADWRKSPNLLSVAALHGNLTAWKYFMSINYPFEESLHSIFEGDSKGNLLEMMQVILKDERTQINFQRPPYMESPLFAAVQQYNRSPDLMQVVEYLVDNGADLVMKNCDGDTILHVASAYRSAHEYHYIVSLYSTQSLKDTLLSRNKSYCLPLHYAVRDLEIQKDTLRLFADNCDMNAVDQYGNSVLAYAIGGMRSASFLEHLIQLGVQCHFPTTNPWTLLHEAASFDNLEALKYFVAKGCCDINAVDLNGNTPLHISLVSEVSIHKKEIVRVLLEAGTDVNIKNLDNKTACDLAVKRCNFGTLDAGILNLLTNYIDANIM